MLSPLGAGLSQAFRPMIRWRSVTCTTAESNQPDPCRRRMPCQATVRSRRGGSRWSDESALERSNADGAWRTGRWSCRRRASGHADRRRDARRRLDHDRVVHPQRPFRADADLLRHRAPGARGGGGAGLPPEPQRPDAAHGQHRHDRAHLRLPGRRPRLEPDAARRRGCGPRGRPPADDRRDRRRRRGARRPTSTSCSTGRSTGSSTRPGPRRWSACPSPCACDAPCC